MIAPFRTHRTAATACWKQRIDYILNACGFSPPLAYEAHLALLKARVTMQLKCMIRAHSEQRASVGVDELGHTRAVRSPATLGDYIMSHCNEKL
jgi:hypothetical protein